MYSIGWYFKIIDNERIDSKNKDTIFLFYLCKEKFVGSENPFEFDFRFKKFAAFLLLFHFMMATWLFM